MMKKSLSLFLIVLLSIGVFGQQLLKENVSGLEYLIKKGTGNDVVILLHGYGSNEKDLFSFAQYFPAETTVICPRGAISYSPTSFSWYDIQFKQDGNHLRNMEQAKQSAYKIELFLSIIKMELNINGSTVIGGFSQGAIMSINLAMEKPELIDGVIGMSGTLLHEKLSPNPNYYNDYKNLNVFYAHGTQDQLLPIAHGLNCKKLLEKAQVNLTYNEYPIAHTISNEELQDILNWYKANF